VENLDLIQTHYIGNPWKIMISCILLNQTNNRQVRPVIIKFLEVFPTPNSLDESHLDIISQILKPTGFQNIKAKRILNFTKVWNSGERDPNKFPGIGPYGRDTWKIFMEDKTDFIPEDKKLSAYLAQLNG
jgi:methyl-CpG-binding domain protein 4